jgi:hypothetical protein
MVANTINKIVVDFRDKFIVLLFNSQRTFERDKKDSSILSMVLIIDFTFLRSDVCNIRYDEEVKLQPKHDNKQRND